uniref:Uncharacterized protein n=1 Tax=Gorilla gorilla gorilla TaxID=9595 RepID=G3S1W0_GORGO
MLRWFVQQPTSCSHAQPLPPPHRTASLRPLVPSCGSAAWPSLHYLGSPADSGCSRGQRALPAVWPLSCYSQCPQGRPPHPVPRSQRRGSRDLGKEPGEEATLTALPFLHQAPSPPHCLSAGCDPSLTQPSPHPTPPQQGCVTPFHR